ncbi:HSP90 family protein [Thermomonospora cellulosilytica]|uniref:Molecular chaperone HtpG n=1 Tax=Thermomonospora cellulosilytica TaxID=1411118 RepID=A0A7W3R964_9ACTN|nr:HSP90 family protein [Thermomonospora cellulosilytica]MBA9004471.1 molecular chaperone HtpG [Thermomonospora cellulosilytica]
MSGQAGEPGAVRSFGVDLRGIVDLLSRHLYSGPRVYVRELLQNAVDAITARGGGRGTAIRIEARGDGELRIHDTGIGLTEPQVHELLATIGNSSKRDPLGFARHDFLGQFGIGLLSCFLVADEIEVVTRSAVEDAPAVVWRGHADGHYTVRQGRREEAGTTVALRARRDFEHWLEPSTVMELARHYGALLPYDVRVNGEPVTEGTPPWERAWPTERERREALLQYGTRVVGTTPFDVIDLAVPEAGLRGVAYVLPYQTSPGEPAAHRVYLKRMLMGDRVERILPEWAFFVRCVLNSDELRPTASREQLYDDELLDGTRKALGGQLRGWLLRLAAAEPERLRAFLEVHSLGVKAMAARDVEMLRVVDEWVAFQTSEGAVALAEFRARHRAIRYTARVEEFQQFASIAAAQGIALVNGGYAYDPEILERLRLIDPDLDVRRLDPAELATRLDPVGPAVAFAARDFLRVAERTLAGHGCEPTLREFSPATLPVLYLEGTRPVADAREAGGVWAEFADDAEEQARPSLVFNHRNPLVARLTSTVNAEVVALAVEALYGYALLAGRRPMRPDDVAGVNRAFLGLVEHAVRRDAP